LDNDRCGNWHRNTSDDWDWYWTGNWHWYVLDDWDWVGSRHCMWHWSVNWIWDWPLDRHCVRGGNLDWVWPFYWVRDGVWHWDGNGPLYGHWVRGGNLLGMTVDDVNILGDWDQWADSRCWGSRVCRRSGDDSGSAV